MDYSPLCISVCLSFLGKFFLKFKLNKIQRFFGKNKFRIFRIQTSTSYSDCDKVLDKCKSIYDINHLSQDIIEENLRKALIYLNQVTKPLGIVFNTPRYDHSVKGRSKMYWLLTEEETGIKNSRFLVGLEEQKTASENEFYLSEMYKQEGAKVRRSVFLSELLNPTCHVIGIKL